MGAGRICCVPFCPSKSGTPGISLHEIPSTLEIRQQWLKVISRADSQNQNKNWQPGSRSAVCSRHFLEIDYVPDHKQKRLKKDAIPSVFPEYPSHKLRNTSHKRRPPRDRSSPPLKRSRKVDVQPTETGRETPPPSMILPKSDDTKELHSVICRMKSRIKNLLNTVRRKNQTIQGLKENVKSQAKPHPYQSSIEKLKVDANNGEIKALLLLQQIEAYGKTRFRWSELCLRMCVLWRSKSPRAYSFARAQFVNLPCRTTLQKYIGPSSLETGLTTLARLRLKEEIESISEIEKVCSLIFDEMSIVPKLQYRKQPDKIVGEAEYGKGAGKIGSPDGLANRLLCFVLKGLSTNYRIPIAYYLVRQLQGADLAKLILAVVEEVEKLGLKVCRLVCDDGTINVKALEILCDGQLCHKISHPVREGHPLFLSFDQCHIIKNVRNQFLDEGRSLCNMGETISSKPLKLLYETQKNLPIKPVRFLTRKSVYPTNFEKMNVKRAMQIFSTEVIAALEFCRFKNLPGFRNIDGTLEFMKIIHKWFQVHNVCNTTHYIHSRDESKKHFGMIDDDRLEWLETCFLNYIDSWKNFTESSDHSKGRRRSFLTRETYTAIKITTLSTVGCIRYLIECGFHFVLTRKFSSDDVEGIFSAVRASQGHNDQANAVGSLYALETILKTGLFSSSMHANCSSGNVDCVEVVSKQNRINVTGRILPPGTIMELNHAQKNLVSKLVDPPDIPNVTTKSAGVAMVAGFALRLLKDRNPCAYAGSNLTGSNEDVINMLVTLQDRGGLMYPSRSFVCFVKLIFDILYEVKYFNSESLVKSWTMTIINILPRDSLECGCKDASHTVLNRRLIIGSLCKIFFNNTCFNITDSANDKPKFTSKPASKKVKKL